MIKPITFFILSLLLKTSAHGQGFEHFITTKGSKLMDGSEEFRFLSFNIPNLNYIEDEMSFTSTNPYGLPNEYEIRDAFETIRQMGGRVVRMYTIPVRNQRLPEEAVTYVEGAEFNEAAFRVMDLVLALANEYQIRLIFPLVNNWQWMGGVPNYAAFRSKEWADFWTDKELISDFKQTIEFVVNRTNTITGIAYKEDKAILCWETGNELQGPHSWTQEIARYIKSLDANHLIMDGYHAVNGTPIREAAILEPAIDIVTSHHYEKNPLKMLQHVQRKAAQVDGRKPYIIGEAGFISSAGMAALLDAVIDNPDISGALGWSLRYHHRHGGFYWHSEPVGLGLYKAYHWPGFASGNAYDEQNYLRMWRQRAFAIQSIAPPAVPIPQPPEILPIEAPHRISWQGSAGAAGYQLERAVQPDGPWQLVGYQMDAASVPYFPFYHDQTALAGVGYYYRLIAVNESGASAPSPVIGPVTFTRQAIVDNLHNVGKLYSSRKISIQGGNDRIYKEARKRAFGKRGACIEYYVPGPLMNLRVYAFEKGSKNRLRLYASMDGKNYQLIDADVGSFRIKESFYNYAYPKLYTYSEAGNWKFIRIEFRRAASVSRVEIEYETYQE